MDCSEVTKRELDRLWLRDDKTLDLMEAAIRKQIHCKGELPRFLGDLATVLNEQERRRIHQQEKVRAQQRERVVRAVERITLTLDKIEESNRLGLISNEVAQRQRDEIGDALREIRADLKDSELLETLEQIRDRIVDD